MKSGIFSMKKLASIPFALILTAVFGLAVGASLPESGSKLPEMTLKAPANLEHKEYLGVSPHAETFTLEKMSGRLLFIEIVGVYCPQCHIQFPKINKLFYRIQKDPALRDKVRVLAVAAGGNANETAFLARQFKIPYPVVPDPDYAVHKLLGEPRTPFNMLVTDGNVVVHTHMGAISDMDDFYDRLMKLAP